MPNDKYIVATYNGHGEWSLSDPLELDEVLERIAGGVGTDFRVFKEQTVTLNIADKE